MRVGEVVGETDAVAGTGVNGDVAVIGGWIVEVLVGRSGYAEEAGG
jgi:hypothetical protein